MVRTALLLVNRKSRRGKQNIADIRARFIDASWNLVEEACQQPQDLSAVIRQHRHDVDLVILGGGDGTIHHALEGLIECRLPLGILPLGTANDLAHTLELPTDPLMACDVILQQHTQAIDLGLVNGKPFCNVASLGLAVRITDRLKRSTKSRWGVFAYAFAAIQSLIHARPFGMEIECDGTGATVRTVQVTVGNGRYYGGGLTVNHSATVQDNLLHLYSLEVKRWWHLIPLLPSLRSGDFDSAQNVRTLEGKELQLRSRGSEHRIVADGELVSTTPATFRLLPGILKVYVPKQTHHS